MESDQQLPATLLVPQHEAARLLGGIDRTTVWRMVKRGELKQVAVGRRAMIRRDSIDAFIACSSGEAPPEGAAS